LFHQSRIEPCDDVHVEARRRIVGGDTQTSTPTVDLDGLAGIEDVVEHPVDVGPELRRRDLHDANRTGRPYASRPLGRTRGT